MSRQIGRKLRWKKVGEPGVASRAGRQGARKRTRPETSSDATSDARDIRSDARDVREAAPDIRAAVTARTASALAYDPRDLSGMLGQSPYESSYDIAHGYALDRSIVLP